MISKTVLVTGSRNWGDEETIRRVLAHVENMEYRGTTFTLREGGAQGADCLAARIAHEMGWEVQTVKADWARYKNGAGLRRNIEMIKMNPVPDLCVAFIKNNSGGATHCASNATKAGIPTLYYREDTENDES